MKRRTFLQSTAKLAMIGTMASVFRPAYAWCDTQHAALPEQKGLFDLRIDSCALNEMDGSARL